MFITTGEFLPQHREHRTQVLQIISAAENLDTIIGTLEDETGRPDRTADAGVSTVLDRLPLRELPVCLPVCLPVASCLS